MAETMMDDGSEDVNDFLRRIAELDERRTREDEERTKRLEEEILKGRRERLERRAERARSISPTKDSPSETPVPLRLTSHQHQSTPDLGALSPKEQERSSPRPSATKEDGGEGASRFEQPSTPIAGATPLFSPRVPESVPDQTNRSSLSKPSPSTAIAPSRMSPLSWQRRPDPSQPGWRGNQPGSAVTRDGPASQSPPPPSTKPSSVDEGQMSKADISRLLLSKDPTWFRQTEDRGAGSPAYRRDHGDASAAAGSVRGRTRLPGMASDVRYSDQSEVGSPPESVRSTSPSRASLARNSAEPSTYSTNTSISAAKGFGGTSLPDMSAYRSELSSTTSPTATDQGVSGQAVGARSLAMSPSQGRIVPEKFERPASPTKGLGGFVQSAMMKRSDSVQKRWSAQPMTMLGRENSIAGRDAFDGLGNVGSGGPYGLSERERRSRTSSTDISASSDNISHLLDKDHQAQAETRSRYSVQGRASVVSEPIDESHETPTSHATSARRSVASTDDLEKESLRFSQPSLVSTPSSPTKLADQKRWSPSKASWLESALNKTAEPRKMKSPVPEQPSWMVGAAKWKQQDGKPVAARERSFEEVKTGGFMRAPALGTPVKPAGLIVNKPVHASSAKPGKITPGLEKSHPELPEQNTPAVESETPQPTPKPLEVAKDASEETHSSDKPAGDADKLASEPEPKSSETPTNAKQQHRPETKLSPPVGKPKPLTPPKKDFRSVLKSRQAPDTTLQKEEPEFKNVFGKLKHTTTQRYVAPDELKDNILRGKAGLNMSGGPNKTERRDELKESLLRQKEAMKARSGSDKQTLSESGAAAMKSHDAELPEAIAKRRLLSKSADTAVGRNEKESSMPEAVAKQKALRVAAKPTETPERPKPAGLPAKPDTAASGAAPTPFNQRLAGLLSKGPPVLGPRKVSEDAGAASPEPALKSREKSPSEAPTAAGSLTHLTKDRVKGPKRRPPKSKGQEEGPSDVGTVASAHTSNNAGEERVGVPTPAQSMELGQTATRDLSVEGGHVTRLRKASPSPSRRVASGSSGAQSHAPPPAPKLFRQENHPIGRRILGAASAGATAIETQPAETSASRESQNAPALTPSSDIRRLRSPQRAAEHSPTLSKAEEQKTPQSFSRSPVRLGRPLPSTPAKGLGLVFDNNNNGDITPPHTTPKEKVKEELQFVPSPSPKPASLAVRSGASKVFADFFTDLSARPAELNLDIERVLLSHPDDLGNIKTLKKQIWQVTGDGKQEALPAHQEHILFEDNMYVCNHYFRTSDGTSGTEVFLWAGDNVPEAAIEDAQLFARRSARANGGRLVKLRQGLETANFFQALGGIIVIRRGSSSRADASTPYMLCGRRHLGHIAFDEVDFSFDSLCSGFPYIIYSPPRRTYIWKGKGSAADELGCARLIGMDSGMAGADLEEVDEGKETPRFLELLGAGTTPNRLVSGEHWLLKPKSEDYQVRLFCIQHELGAKIIELSPFSQADLKPSAIYLLDAFFEIYIIIGNKAHSRFGDLQVALRFATEYSELAHAKQNRPHVPSTKVVLGTPPPRDVKAVFRKWRDEFSGGSGSRTEANRTERVITLEEATEAVAVLTRS